MIFFFIRILAKVLLWLRYRIHVRGLEDVKKLGNKSVLFLPNHPCLIDPVILSSTLAADFRPRALVTEKQVRTTPLRYMRKQLRILEIPDLGVVGKTGIDKVEKQIGNCVEALRNGDNVLLYPAGRIYRSRFEDLRANGGVKRILEMYPEVRIVLVRTRGLWGSSFGRAKGYQTTFLETIFANLKTLFINFLIFTPRRDVTVEFFNCPDDFPKNESKEIINRYLEAFYNHDAPHNTYVPYRWWEKGGARSMPEPENFAPKINTDQVPADVRKTVYSKILEMTSNRIINDANLLGTDLGLDSLMVADLQLWIQDTFGHQVNNPETLRTVGSVLLAAMGQSDGIQPLRPIPKEWFIEPNKTPLEIPDGTKVTEVFLKNAAKFPDRVLLADQNKGICSYKKMVLAIMVLKSAIEKIPGERIGILMPACMPVVLVYFATLFANKVPVMINWTVGLRNMRHCLKNAQVEHILTSQVVIEQLEGRGTQFEEIKDTFIYLEELAKGVSFFTKIRCLLASKFNWSSLRNAPVQDTAVILFTSGSENLPKAVPLTHLNLLNDAKYAMKHIDMTLDDCILGMLPPFHSFGVMINFIISTCSNCRLVFHANPTEGEMLARIVAAYRVTMGVGTPTFIAGIFRNATQEQVQSIRMTITGAEKCPQSTYELIHSKCPTAHVLEGYGITECGPIAALNPIVNAKQGTLGKPIGCEEWTVRDENLQPVPYDMTGMLYLRGANIFSGYMNYDGPSPFVTIDGKEYYQTGDLVSADADGFLTFRGRKKRFVKIAGEMVSLPAIEEVLQKHFKATDESLAIAVESVGTEEQPDITLFTTLDLERDDVNHTIRESGLSPIHSIKQIVKVAEIPILGTGKTDYRTLKSSFQNK
ncbi:MAG: AMP-binding protein [Victivallales bacterium]|nr:AMP-binding protein [Victivallales bacterium]